MSRIGWSFRVLPTTLIEAAARVLRPPSMQVVEHIGVRMYRWLPGTGPAKFQTGARPAQSLISSIRTAVVHAPAPTEPARRERRRTGAEPARRSQRSRDA